MKKGEDLGVTSKLNINNNVVKVNVTESPIFVKVSGKSEDKNEEKKEEVTTTTKVVNKTTTTPSANKNIIEVPVPATDSNINALSIIASMIIISGIVSLIKNRKE